MIDGEARGERLVAFCWLEIHLLSYTRVHVQLHFCFDWVQIFTFKLECRIRVLNWKLEVDGFGLNSHEYSFCLL